MNNTQHIPKNPQEQKKQQKNAPPHPSHHKEKTGEEKAHVENDGAEEP